MFLGDATQFLARTRPHSPSPAHERVLAREARGGISDVPGLPHTGKVAASGAFGGFVLKSYRKGTVSEHIGL